MKLFFVVEKSYEYNDEYYYPRKGDGKPVKAYRNQTNAEAAAYRMSRESKANMMDEHDKPIADVFEVREYDIEDDQVETAPTADAVSAAADGPTDYASAREAVKAAVERAKELSQDAFKQGAAELFAAHPELKSFGWTQYTPYFNDGDTCVFRVRADEPDINGEDGDDLYTGRGEKYDPATNMYVKDGEPTVEYELQRHVETFLQQFDEDDMEAMFGDHVEVTVNRPRGKGKVKIEKEEYSHD